MRQVRSIAPFEYHQPESLEDVISLLQKYGTESALLAGGTALLVDMQHGELTPSHIVSLWSVSGLNGVSLNGTVRIGALTTVSDLVDALGNHIALASLTEAGLMLGSRQVQNMCTVGGNICKASPGADMVPPLLCLDAMLTLQGPDGERNVPLDGFLTGPDQTALGPAEVLTEIALPDIMPRTGSAFEKVMRRLAVDCSIISVAARVTLEEDGNTCRDVRIAVAAAAPNPFRAKAAEEVLVGKPFSEDRARAAGGLAREESDPIDDVRASAEYRRLLLEELVPRALERATERAQAI